MARADPAESATGGGAAACTGAQEALAGGYAGPELTPPTLVRSTAVARYV